MRILPFIMIALLTQCGRADRSDQALKINAPTEYKGIKVFLDEAFKDCIAKKAMCDCKNITSFPMVIMDFDSLKITVADSRFNGYEFNIFDVKKVSHTDYKIINSETYDGRLIVKDKGYFFESGNSSQQLLEQVVKNVNHLTGWEVFDIVRTEALDKYLLEQYDFSVSKNLSIRNYNLKCFKFIESSIIVLNDDGNHVLELEKSKINIYELGEMNIGPNMVIDTNLVQSFMASERKE